MAKTKKAYVPPRLELLSSLGMQKHRTVDISAADSGSEDIGDVKALLAEFGSPLYVVSEKTLRSVFRTFRDTFTAPGIDTVVAYSYKTNYLPAVCAILHQEGAWAEVVSGMEYDLACSLGVPGEQIIFNGPYKRADELARAVADGALINVDNFDELDLLIAVAGNLKKTARMGLRINFQHGRQSWTKFGFNADSGDASEALQRVKKAGRKFRLEALHNHSGTFQINPDIYARAAQVLSSVAKRARDMGLAPNIVDFGGGYPSSNRLKPAFEPVGGVAAGQHLAPFAEAIIGGIGKARKVFGERPMVVLEPGRAVVDAAMKLACTVVSRKSIPGQGDAVIVDAGVNLLPTAYWYDHGVDAVAGSDMDAALGSKPVAVFGPLCMQIDVLRERAVLPPMSLGSPLLVSNVGAYCLTQSMQFIQPRPAVVLVGPKGPELIRRRETREDIFSLDKVPPRLASRRSGK
ncbi:MAG: diaminopimelate decarboxylase [Betaproteobacteria bacterium]|nr:diaminopimelate decarboxylase [Betaproteobacteria bacterium]